MRSRWFIAMRISASWWIGIRRSGRSIRTWRATRVRTFIASGIGLVSDPVQQAAPPVLATTPGPQGGGTFYASVAWVNAAGQEGAAVVRVVDHGDATET